MDFNELIVRFATTIARRRLFFLLVFLVGFSAAVVGAYVKPQSFESKATLLVSLESQRMNTSGSEERKVIAHLQPDEVMASLVELMQTRELMEKLVDELPAWVFESKPSTKWYVRMITAVVNPIIRTANSLLVKAKLIEPTNPRYEKIRLVEKGLTVFPVRKSQVIELSFLSKNPKISEIVLNTIIELYKARAAELKAKSDGAKLYWRQSEKLSKDLEAAEKSLSEFMLEHGIIDIEVERQQILGRLNTMASVIHPYEVEGQATDNFTFTITGPDTPPQILLQISTLNSLVSERARFAASYTENHRDVLRLNRQIESVRKELSGDYSNLFQAAKHDRARLEKLLNIEPHYNRLSRRVRTLTSSLEIYRKAAEDRETFFNRDNQIQAQIIDAPAVSYMPRKPSRLILVIAGFFFALIVAVVIVLLVEWIAQIRLVYGKNKSEAARQPAATFLDAGA